jgi:hypothetical protein
MRAWPFVAALVLGLSAGCQPAPAEHSSASSHVEEARHDDARSTYSPSTPSASDRYARMGYGHAGLASYGSEAPRLGRFSSLGLTSLGLARLGLTSRTALLMSVGGAVIGGFGFSFLMVGNSSPVNIITGGGSTTGWLFALAGAMTFGVRRAEVEPPAKAPEKRRPAAEPAMPEDMPAPAPIPAPSE